MPQVIEKTVYTFAELDGRARERAREWFLDGMNDDSSFVIADFETICGLMGVQLAQRSVMLMSGKDRNEPRVYWSGFWSQGDGACFDGAYCYRKAAAQAIREHAPRDVELHQIAEALEGAQRPFFYQLTARCRQRGHYMHSGCMAVDVEDARDRCRDVSAAEDAITRALRRLADWFYDQLRNEYEDQESEAVVAVTMEGNGYTFDEDGRIA
jgi:hypothetical protein